ncbi:hypothetical protein vseg_015423 [Gypsophila vaccaria]
MSSSSGIAVPSASAYVEVNVLSPRMSSRTATLASLSSLSLSWSSLKYNNKRKIERKNKKGWRSECESSVSSSSHQSSTSSDFNLNLNHADTATDPDLRVVLELATPSELFELHHILFRPSYFSPLLKSVPNAMQLDPFMIQHDFQERQHFITSLESRFLFLAADARSTLRGWRPSYRNVLLDVRKELKVPCSTRLSVEDLEIEIFVFMIQEWSRDNDTATAVRFGAEELCSALLKGGQLVSLLKISQMVSTKLSGKMLLETTKHKFGNEAIKKGLTGATSRYLGLGSLASLFGPLLWGTFLADVVIQMLGTDYIRVLQAIYALAQIRILRRHGLHLDKL